MNHVSSSNPIGVFDSGVGGLSVLRAIREELPTEEVIYFADQAHVPYGSRSLEEVRGFSIEITRFLLDLGAKIIVVACNTASAAALNELRLTFPEVPFVGMEPAVKPAARRTQSGVVGVLATPATFQGTLYASVVERYANNITIIQKTCPGLVAQIETGNIDDPLTEQILTDALSPMVDANADMVVLGCTHYPFVIPTVKRILGENITVIDPAPAVARQVRRLLNSNGLLSTQAPLMDFDLKKSTFIKLFTTGSTFNFGSVVKKLLGISSSIQEIHWDNNKLQL
jgi:glutamate racemase